MIHFSVKGVEIRQGSRLGHFALPGFFRISNCTPLVFFFSEATIKVYTWIFFLKSHYKSLYLDFCRISNCTPPPCVFFFSEATIKVYTWIFLKPLLKSIPKLSDKATLAPPPPDPRLGGGGGIYTPIPQ